MTALNHEYAASHVIPAHYHDRDQLLYACRGVMTIRTKEGTWVVPPSRAVWIPASVAHTITMSGVVSMRTLYFKPRAAKSLPRSCCVVNVSPLLKELILHACTFRALRKNVERERHVIDLIQDQVTALKAIPLQLPNLSDARALRIAEKLIAYPDTQQTLAELCRASGASKRTIERLFLQETGLTFGKWRQQLRTMHALRLLAEGASVTQVALEAGYSTPSAFVAAFKQLLGTTPIAYFRLPEQLHSRLE